MSDNVVAFRPANVTTAPKLKSTGFKRKLKWMAVMVGGEFCTVYEDGKSFLAPVDRVFPKPKAQA